MPDLPSDLSWRKSSLPTPDLVGWKRALGPSEGGVSGLTGKQSLCWNLKGWTGNSLILTRSENQLKIKIVLNNIAKLSIMLLKYYTLASCKK